MKTAWELLLKSLVILALLLALFAAPLIRRRHRTWNEGATKSGLAALRAAVERYRQDNNDRLPPDLTALTEGGRYLQAIPSTDFYQPKADVRYGNRPDGAGGWMYDNVPGDPDYGMVWANSTHTDSKGSVWSAY